MNSGSSSDTCASLDTLLLLPGEVWVVCLSNRHGDARGGVSSSTGHIGMVSHMGICFSLLCRNIHLGGGSGESVLCSLHIFFGEKNSDSLRYLPSASLLPSPFTWRVPPDPHSALIQLCLRPP